jgi:transposase-like protein
MSKYDLEAIKQDVLFTTLTVRQIAAKHGVKSPSTISKMVKREGWNRQKKDKDTKRKKQNLNKDTNRTQKKGTCYPTHSLQEYAEAIYDNDGNITEAAKQLGVNRSSLSRRVQREMLLLEARFEAEERLLDHAESALWKLIKDGNFNAIKLALMSKGKNRGWNLEPIPATADDEQDHSTEFVQDC